MAKIKVIGVPMDLGASRRGVDMGPSALRIARIGPRLGELGHEVSDFGNVPVREPETMSMGERKNKYLPEIAETCNHLAQATYAACQEGFMPLVLGGDHSIAIGTVAGISRHYHE